ETPPVPAKPSEAVATGTEAGEMPLATQLRTVYANLVEPQRIRDIPTLALRGERCVVLTNFAVKRICGVSGADATRVEELLVVKCCACGH
ncbi:unnamed protein product, partial [Symbiodinium pilosum]